MKIVVIGDTGLIGSKTVALLRAAGHDVLAAAPDTGVDTVTGEGLAQALAGADVNGGHAVDDVGDEVKAVKVVQHDHVEGGGRRSFFFVAAHVQVVMVRAPIGQAMDEQRIPVIGKDDRLVGREEEVELFIA